jgi:hypothetical protein
VSPGALPGVPRSTPVRPRPVGTMGANRSPDGPAPFPPPGIGISSPGNRYQDSGPVPPPRTRDRESIPRTSDLDPRDIGALHPGGRSDPSRGKVSPGHRTAPPARTIGPDIRSEKSWWRFQSPRASLAPAAHPGGPGRHPRRSVPRTSSLGSRASPPRVAPTGPSRGRNPPPRIGRPAPAAPPRDDGRPGRSGPVFVPRSTRAGRLRAPPSGRAGGAAARHPAPRHPGRVLRGADPPPRIGRPPPAAPARDDARPGLRAGSGPPGRSILSPGALQGRPPRVAAGAATAAGSRPVGPSSAARRGPAGMAARVFRGTSSPRPAAGATAYGPRPRNSRQCPTMRPAAWPSP